MWCCPFHPFSCFLLSWPLRAIYLLFYGEITKGQCHAPKTQLPKVISRGILRRFALLPENIPLSPTLDSWDFQNILLSIRKDRAHAKHQPTTGTIPGLNVFMKDFCSLWQNSIKKLWHQNPPHPEQPEWNLELSSAAWGNLREDEGDTIVQTSRLEKSK